MKLRNRLVFLITAALPLYCAGLRAQESATPAGSVAAGKVVFQLHCAPCHGAGRGDGGRELLPGTDALRIKYQGKVPALLEQRSDLPAPVLKVFVRRGSWSMPPFRQTEVSDADIDNIAAYLAATARGTSR
jgi:mono/diheme cytochrome c family protein